MGKFQDQVAVITGAGQGAGKKLATRFYEEGAIVCLLDLNGKNLASVVEEVKPDEDRFVTYTADVSNSSQVTAVMEDIGRRFGKIDILISVLNIVKCA